MPVASRTRKRRSYRERPVYVMDTEAFYLDVISCCEELVLDQATLGFGAVAGSSLSMLVKEKYGTQFRRPYSSEREGRLPLSDLAPGRRRMRRRGSSTRCRRLPQCSGWLRAGRSGAMARRETRQR